MAIYTGKTGLVKADANTVGEIGEWSAQISKEFEDTTKFGDTFKSKTATIGDWNGSFNGRSDMSDAGQTALKAALLSGTPVAITLQQDTGKTITGNVLITGMNPSTTATGVATTAWNFEGTGAPTLT